MRNINKPELLAPAGSLIKLKTAILYGADAVYCAGHSFGLRTASKNFDIEELREGVDFAHSHGAKVYITVNAYPRNEELAELPAYLKELESVNVDAVIVSDLGVFNIVRETCPDMEIHVSTQANTTNYSACNLWYKIGARRAVLARELSLAEITEIREKIPSDMELEVFIHGAMCISYSGRCLLSNYMTGRDSNRGDCAQACRWKYSLVEEKRQGEYFPIEENEQGSFIFNSKDLCLIKRIPDLIEAGVKSLKIEGRVKSEFYVATVVFAYRKVIDEYMKDPNNFVFKEEWAEEALKNSHREYFEGFIDGDFTDGQIYGSASYIRDYEVMAFVTDYDEENKLAVCRQRNKFYKGATLAAITPDGRLVKFTADVLKNSSKTDVDSVPHSDEVIYISCPESLPHYSFIRMRVGENK